ncbi:MAG: VWA domain-containing protein [Clostridiales bacterium]|nr:VWA domain-containing protein [Clostridiales bacterium]
MKQKRLSTLLVLAMLILALLTGACMRAEAPAPYAPPYDGALAEPEYDIWDVDVPEIDDPDDWWDYDPAPSTTGEPGSAPKSAGKYSDDGDYVYAPNNEKYIDIDENTRKSTARDPMLTFSLKVDSASYANVARYIESGKLPPKNAVRTEELINYFNYDEVLKLESGSPFALYTELGPSPFDPNKYMAFVRVKARELDKSQLPPSNLTFLIDVSGSMSPHDRLPLLKDAFALLVDSLDASDRVSIVTYASGTTIVLDGAKGSEKNKILGAIYGLDAGGSTAGEAGIQTAYRLAERNFLQGGNNRIILATDGDFNVGTSNTKELERLVANKKESGIYLSVLGVGTGNLREDIMETLAKHGSGNYAYLNSLATAEKVLVDELASNLFVIAEDVKAQVEFNPANVKSYRLIGYENRALDNRDFANDNKDAGEIGVGTDIIVLFEIELADEIMGSGLKYSSGAVEPNRKAAYGNELFEVRLRYKKPGESNSRLTTLPVTFDRILKRNTADFNFACSVAAFGDMLRGSAYARDITVNDLLALCEDSLGLDLKGYRYSYLELLGRLKKIYN